MAAPDPLSTWKGPPGNAWTGPITPANRPSAGGSRSGTGRCGAISGPQSVLQVSRLIAAMGNALDGPGFALAEVIT